MSLFFIYHVAQSLSLFLSRPNRHAKLFLVTYIKSEFWDYQHIFKILGM